MPGVDPNHPDSADLAAFGLGRMDACSSAVIEAHVLACDTCAEALERTPNDAWIDHFRQAATTADAAATSAELAGHPRYRILKLLGRGGMGAVYLAEHGVMRRRVALKVVKPEYTANPTAVKRFRREIHATGRLHHPNIVAAHDAEQVGETHFLVMEYIDGVSLDRLVAERGPLPVAEACEYVRQAALGLQHAHERGMVHRDVKPHNLIRTTDGVVKVLDFGLASIAEPGDGAATAPNVVMGTPDYIAPEQAEDSHAADARSDIYALGCTLYFLLTGRPPFARSSPLRTLLAHRDEAPTPLSQARPDAPAGLADVLLRLTAKAPAERYQTAAEVAVALAPFVGAPRGERRPPRRRLLVAGAAAALLMAVLAAAAVVVRIPTDQGEVTITTDDPNVELVVQKGGKVVRIVDPQSKQTWELDPEKYQLGMADQPDGLTIGLKGREPIVLRRKGEKVVTITREPAPAVGPEPKPAAEAQAAIPQELEVAHRLPWPGRQPLPRTAFSADGRLCCACGGDLVRVWDVETGRVLQDFTGLPLETNWIVFLPDGKQLLSSHTDGSFRRLDVATGKQMGELQTDIGWKQIHGVTPDGGRFCWWGGEGRPDTIHIWDLETRNERFRVAPAEAESLLAKHQLSPDGRLLLTADQMPNGTGLLRVFDVSSGERVRSIETDVHPDTPTWSEDGRRIYLSGATDGDARFVVVAGFDAETGKEISRVPLAPAPRASRGRYFSRDGRWFAVQYPDLALVHLYETETGKLVAAAHGPDVEFTFSFSPKGTYAACGKKGEVILYRLPALPAAGDRP